MNKRIEYVVQYLKDNYPDDYVCEAFDLFRSNQIDVEELEEVLKYDNYVLPDDFYKLHKFDQKKYFSIYKTMAYYENNEFIEETDIIFDKSYFYYLVERSRKTQKGTRKLIEYIHDLEDTNLKFLGMKYIKLQYTSFANDRSLMKFAKTNNIADLYSLVVFLFSSRPSEEINRYINIVKKKIYDEYFLCFNLDNYFNKFSLYIECLLANLSKKDANSIKYKYSILTKEHLKDKDYDENKNIRKLLLEIKTNNIFKNILIKLQEFAKKNEYQLKRFGPNGYYAFYTALIGDDSHG